MKNIEESSKNEKMRVSETVKTISVNLIPIATDTLRKSCYEMIGDSCQIYSGRVWNVVRADMDDHIDQIDGKFF